MTEAESIKEFFALVSPGFCMEGELPAVHLDGIEVRGDGHAVAMVHADGRTNVAGLLRWVATRRCDAFRSMRDALAALRALEEAATA